MADEIRRSGRATKGQAKDRTIHETPAKKKGKEKASKAKVVEEEEEEEEDAADSVRCVCGEYEEETDVPIPMVCCDNCDKWQHNDCMGLPKEYKKPAYFCEQCRPEDHKELLAAIERGEKPWETIPRKGGDGFKQKGRKGRKSTAAADESPKPGTPVGAGQKRKAEESPAVAEIKGNKKARATPTADTNGNNASARKASTPAYPVVGSVGELHGSRQPLAKGIIKLFIDLSSKIVKLGTVAIPQGQTFDELATSTGLAIESAVYHVRSSGKSEPSDEQRDYMRALFTNLKKNVPLTCRLLNREVTAEELAAMKPEDLATDEQKQQDAVEEQNAKKQHILVDDEPKGPRIRRTHKGDEYVGDEPTASEPATKPVQPKQEDDKAASPKAPMRKQPSVTIPNSGGPRRQSSANFNIDKVYANVQGSPDGDRPRLVDGATAAFPENEPAGPGARPDNDIDRLLEDEDEEPYSPKADNVPEGVVWQGVINGGNLGRFRTSARYAVGATPDVDTLQTTWAALLPDEIGIGGRIAPTKADEYLCGLEWSTSSDLLIVWMHEPESAPDRDQFNRFFTYFKSKGRFGVGSQAHNPALKDIYFVPLEKGEEMPAFVRKIESDFPNTASARMLIVPLVVRNTELAHNVGAAAQMDGAGVFSPAVHQTPITPRDEWHAGQNGGIASAPHMQAPPPSYTSPPPPYPGAAQPQISQQPSMDMRAVSTPNQLAPPPAAIAAHRILGVNASKPAVLALIHSAPDAGDEEMKVVKECIDENPEAGQDLRILTQMLQQRHDSRQQPGAMEGVQATNAPQA